MDQFEKLRPVGRLEKYSTARHQVGFYLNLAVAATYTLPKEYTLSIKDYVFKACAAVIEEHPILSAIPAADDTQEPYFVRLPTIDLNQVVQFTQRQQKSSNSTLTGDNDLTPDLDLQAVLQSEHNKPFAAPNPFWRLHVLLDKEDNSRFTVALILHHALGDGTSAKSFHLSFLCALRSTSDGEISHTVMTPQVPLLPNIEDIHPMSLSFWFLAKKIFQAKIYSPRDPGLWTGSKILLPTSTRIRLVPFSKKLVGQLRSACRQESTTITALLQTVYARALFKNIPESFTRLNCTGAFSTRRFLPDIITEGSMGVFVADIEESYTRSTVLPRDSITFPWEEARRSRKTIQAALDRQGADTGPNLLKFVNDYQKELCLSKVGEDRDKSFEVSNIGAVVFTEDPSLPCIQDMAFSQCASVMGNAIGVSVVTGGDGCLVLSLTWQEGVVEDDIMDASIETMKEELRSLSVGK
ncbi:uncharacterized protein N7469_000312 [Penicillium citrinum]|uniref:Alcohol acetyltransferase n=1 Tax=Penicillium citrinum TaxID=5077 RepID=A0A9W9PCG5_PENCI|nr:uncharacterized protein N7469_000312 [Penicillium citrinum]KAJ5241985.1 hypothetical protein N7469_000312 [Penicillium citrinum]